MINLKVESSVTSQNVRLKIDVYDYNADVWVNVPDVASTTSDTVYQHLRNDPTRWISAGRHCACQHPQQGDGAGTLVSWTGQLDWDPPDAELSLASTNTPQHTP